MSNIYTSQRTIYGIHWLNCLSFGRPFTPAPNSTLTQKFGINPSQSRPSNAYPTYKGLVAGIGGLSYSLGTNGLVKLSPVLHKARDASCIAPVPWALRTLDNDLTTAQQANYRLKKQVTVGSETYNAYYMLTFDPTSVTPAENYVNVNSGVTTVNPFTPSVSDLSPTGVGLNSSGVVNISTTDFLAGSARITVNITADQVTELINAITILYGDPGYAVLSEIGLATGYDVSSGGVTEVVDAQVTCFNNTGYVLTSLQGGFAMNLDVGNTEPLIF